MPPWLRKFAFDYLGRLLRVKETSRAVGSDEFQEFTKLINDAGSPGFEKVESNYEGEREMVEHTDGSIAIRQLERAVYNTLTYKKCRDKGKGERHLIQREWILFSLILDRVSFCIYFLITLLTSLVILLHMSIYAHNHD